MRVICTYGSVRGATGNRRPYRDAFASADGGLPPSSGDRKRKLLREHPPTPIPVNANSVNSRKLGTRFTGSGLVSGCAFGRLPFISPSGELLTPLAVSV